MPQAKEKESAEPSSDWLIITMLEEDSVKLDKILKALTK